MLQWANGAPGGLATCHLATLYRSTTSRSIDAASRHSGLVMHSVEVRLTNDIIVYLKCLRRGYSYASCVFLIVVHSFKSFWSYCSVPKFWSYCSLSTFWPYCSSSTIRSVENWMSLMQLFFSVDSLSATDNFQTRRNERTIFYSCSMEMVGVSRFVRLSLLVRVLCSIWAIIFMPSCWNI